MKRCFHSSIQVICFLFLSFYSSVLFGTDCRTIFAFVPGVGIDGAVSKKGQTIKYSFPIKLYVRETIPTSSILTEIADSKWLVLPRTDYIKEYFGMTGAEITEFYVKSYRDFGLLAGSKPARGYKVTLEDIKTLNEKLGRDPYTPITEKYLRRNFSVLIEMDEEYKRRGILPPPLMPLRTDSFFNFKMSRKKVERMNMHMLLHVVRMHLEAVATRYKINKDPRSEKKIINIISQILSYGSLVQTFDDKSHLHRHSRIPALDRFLSRNDFLLENVENYITGFDEQIKELVKMFNEEVGKNYVPKVKGYDKIEQATDEQLEVAFKRAIWSLGKAIYDRNPGVFTKIDRGSNSEPVSLEGYAVAVSPSLLLTTKSAILNLQQEDIVNLLDTKRIGVSNRFGYIESEDVFELSRDSELVLIRVPEGSFSESSIVKLDSLKDATAGALSAEFKEDPKRFYITILGRNSTSEKTFRGQFSFNMGKHIPLSTSYEGYPVSQEGRIVGLFTGDIQNPSFVMFSDDEISKIEKLIREETKSK